MTSLTPELRAFADRAVERALDALHEAAAADPRRGPESALGRRLAAHVGRLQAGALGRLRGRAGRRAERLEAPAPSREGAHRFRWPKGAMADVGGRPAVSRMDLELASLRCVEDSRDVGKDEISLGIVRVVLDHGDPVTSATDVIGPLSMGDFRKGDVRSFSPARTLTSVSPGASLRTVSAVLVLAEIDLGGFGGLLGELAGGVADELLLELLQAGVVLTGAASGVAFFGTLGTIFGPPGVAAGVVLGTALGTAVGYAVGQAIEGLARLVKDEIFPAVEWTVAVPEAAGVVEAREIQFERRHAVYRAKLEWRAR